MAIEILETIKDENTFGLLSKIEIGGKVYELKDLLARESIESLDDLVAALSAKVGNVEEGKNLADIVKNIQENAYDDSELVAAIEALQEADKLLASKEQVAADIKAAVDAEAAIARAAEKANTDEIARVDAALKLAVENDAEGIDSIKELATWVNTHGAAAENMSKAITKNAEDIAAMDEAYKAADAGLGAKIEALENRFEGEGSVEDLIAAAKSEAIAAAAKDASDKDAVVTAAYEAADKAITDSLGALAHKDNATGTVASETISGVKATGTTTGSISVALEATEKNVASAGKFTPVGSVTGTVVPTGSVAVTVSNTAADATLTKGDYTPAGDVSVSLTGTSFNKITGVGTQASFEEGAFAPATIEKTDVTANYATEGIVGSVANECLTFTAAGIAAITATKVGEFFGGSKAADTFVANSLPTMEAHNVGVENATFSGKLAEDLVVTNVSYAKANAEAAATFTGNTNDITATFAGSEGDVNVAGKCHEYAVKTAEFNGAAIELNVGDITVAAKSVTVS